MTSVDARYSTQRNEGFHSLKAHMARKDICWGYVWEAEVAIAILKMNEPNYWAELILRAVGLIGYCISTPVMISNGLRWIWIKRIKNRRKQLTDASKRRRTRAIQRASDAGKSSGYDHAHD